MIIIQRFPTVASLAGFLHNARLRYGRHDFADWLADYTRNRELVVHDYVYRFRDCINLLKTEDIGNA